jgi:hypothetical protein
VFNFAMILAMGDEISGGVVRLVGVLTMMGRRWWGGVVGDRCQ